jgi:hypothetical protein
VTATRLATIAVGGLLVALVTALALTERQLIDARRTIAETRVDSAHHESEIAKARVETVTVKLDMVRDRVIRVPVVQVETLTVDPVTHADTARALAEFKALAVTHDSLQRSCNALVITCDEFRLAATHRDSAQSHEIAVLRDAAKAARPGRWKAAWEKVDQWVYLGGGICIGVAITGHSCLP